jgi:hypothetical protein
VWWRVWRGAGRTWPYYEAEVAERRVPQVGNLVCDMQDEGRRQRRGWGTGTGETDIPLLQPHLLQPQVSESHVARALLNLLPFRR